MFAGWVTVTARDCTIVQIMGWWAGRGLLLLHRCSAMILLMETRWLSRHCNSLIVMMKYGVKENESYI